MEYKQEICVPASGDGVVEIHPPLDVTLEQLDADVFQFKTQAEQKAATLSAPHYFRWHQGIESILELCRRQWYARFGHV